MKSIIEQREELNAKRKQLRDIFEESKNDDNQYDFSKVKTVEGGAQAVADEVKRRNTEIDDLAKKVKDAVDIAKIAKQNQDAIDFEGKPAADSPPHPTGEQHNSKQLKTRRIGKMFVDSDAFKGLAGREGPAAMLDLSVDEMKANFVTSAGWAPESMRDAQAALSPQAPPPQVLDFIPTTPLNQAAAVFMEETTYTANASEKAEATAAGEATLALTERTRIARRIPVFLPVSDEQMADVAEAEGYVNDRLGLMVLQRLAQQCLRGNGTAPNILGTTAVTGIQTQGKGTEPTPDAFYKLFTDIRSDGQAEPSVAFVHPNDWQTIRLLKTADGIYIWGSPSEAGPERIWGVPVVQTTFVAENTAVSGDYANHASLRMRQGLEIRVSDSHGTNFIAGVLAVRATVRAAMVHYRPKAFGTVTAI